MATSASGNKTITTMATTAAPGAAENATAASSSISKPKPSLDIFKQSFREYLQRTHAVETDAELTALMALLHEPLPVSFRVNLHRGEHAQRFSQQLTSPEAFQFASDTFFHGPTAVNPPTPLAWYPLPQVAWQLECGRVALSKTAPKHAAVKNFHAALLDATDTGVVDRQEAVSMLPVLFLDVQPGQSVLDMCASPGSKTTQALDFLSSGASRYGGMVVANDLDKKRAYMLVHRLSRNTLRNAVVTCGSGITFPGLYVNQQLQKTNVFDRVLCDVPCSGDGTLRKSQQLWKEWHIGQGLTLHPIQIALAMRGAALLRVGGVMVYSTCSFNPIENEAVVAELLRRSGGALQVEDVSATLPALVYRKGRTAWPVGWRSKSKSTHKGHLFTKTNDNDDEATPAAFHDWYDSYADLPQELRGQRIVRSMFAPSHEDPLVAQELQKTLRLIPTDQNSGGFFIAVLRKVCDLPGGELQTGLPPLEENLVFTPPADYVCKLCDQKGHLMKSCPSFLPETELSDAAAAVAAPKPKKAKLTATTKAEESETEAATVDADTKRETQYRPLASDAWELLKEFYGLDSTSTQLQSRLWCRSDSAANVNYVDDDIAQACLAGDALEIVNTGLKVFTKLTEKGVTYYRPTEEALGFIDSFFSKRVITLTRSDLETVLAAQQAHVAFDKLSEHAQQQLTGLVIGPAVARLVDIPHVAVNLWVGVGAVLPRVSKILKAEVETELRVLANDAN